MTGRIFEVGGGWVCETRWEQTEGVFFENDFTAEELVAHWDEATSFENARHATSIAESKLGIKERVGRDVALAKQ